MTLERHFATPLIITKAMDEAEFKYEWERMRLRSQATSEFLAGSIELDVFFEALHEGGVDPFQAADDWASGLTYL
jgi:hypothetical protein